VGRNVADLVKAPRRVRYAAVTLNQSQAKALLKAAEKHRLGAIFSVATAVGLPFVVPLDDVIRIRTGERGEAAI